MLLQTFSIISRNLIYYVLIIAALTAFDFLSSDAWTVTGFIVDIFVYVIPVLTSYCVQNSVLFGVGFRNAIASKLRWKSVIIPFILKYTAIYFIITLAALPIVFLGLAFSTPWLESSLNKYLNELSIATFVLTILLALVWSSVGTWLPATVYGRRSTFNDATERGGGQYFLLTFFRLGLAFAFLTFSPFLLQSIHILLFWIQDDRPSLSGNALIFMVVIVNSIYILVGSYIDVVLANIYKKEEVAE